MRISDWSSDVCSSDLRRAARHLRNMAQPPPLPLQTAQKEPDMTMKSADLLVGELADHFARILDAVLPSGKLALVDFPDHSNVGDSAIWLGEIRSIRVPAYSPGTRSYPAAFQPQIGRAHV